MSEISVETSILREYKETLGINNGKARNAFADMINALSAVDVFFINSRIEDTKKELLQKRGIVASQFDIIAKQINKLDEIAAQYEETERSNVNEYNSLNTGGF